MKQRLNKVLARAGLTSRRSADRWISEGRVSVNGETVRRLGLQVDPTRDAIHVDGRPLGRVAPPLTYILLHKPRGYVTTLRDPEGRPTVRDLVSRVGVRLFPVGRLDFHTEGLLLLTNDGPLARTLMHPSSGITKTYRVKVRGAPDARALQSLSRGVNLEGRRTLPARVTVVERGGRTTWLQIVIQEGRNRQVRRMLEAVGLPVQRLRRVAYDGLALGDLPPGEFRHLSAAEVARLRREGPSRRRIHAVSD